MAELDEQGIELEGEGGIAERSHLLALLLERRRADIVETTEVETSLFVGRSSVRKARATIQ